VVFDAVIGGVSDILKWVLSIIPNMNIDTTDFVKMLGDLVEMVKGINVILPISESLVFTGLLVSLRLAFLLLYAATRAINLIRGAG